MAHLVGMSGLRGNLSLLCEGIHMDQVNMDTQSSKIVTLVSLSILVILSVNIPILKEIWKENKYTFINILVGMDCINALMHIPTLGQFYW